MRNLWHLGVEIANNPSFWTRVKHSGRGTAFRRSAKTSTPFKAVASISGYALKQVPVPVVKDMLAAVSDALYKKAKHVHYKKRIAEATSTEEKVKFGWKDLDVQDMDRYRWKVQSAFQDLSKQANDFSRKLDTHTDEGKLCNAFVEVTTKYAYAKRRIDKLRDKTKTVGTLCLLTTRWLNEIEADLDSWALENKQGLTDAFNSTDEDAHENCDGTLCIHSDERKLRLRHARTAQAVSGIASVLGSALDPTEFVFFSNRRDHKIKLDNPWTGETYN